MKVKYSIIPFIPITLAMMALKLMSLFSLDSSGLLFGMSKMNIAYAVIFLALVIFLISVVFNIFDKKTAPAYLVKKNPFSGILAVLCGIAVPVFSFYGLVGLVPDDQYYYLITIITALLSIPAAISFILMSKVHFIGKAASSGISFLFIFPSIWACAQLISEFFNATKISISSNDMTGLFCYIFITLYLFTHSMAISRIKGKNPVKSAFVYGLPAVALTLTYGVYYVVTSVIEKSDIINIFYGAVLIVFGAYALSFIIELFFNCLTVNEVELVDSMTDKEEDNNEGDYTSNIGYDDLVFSHSPSIKDLPRNDNSDYISSTEGLNDFIIGYNAEDDEEPIPYLTKEEMKKSAKHKKMFVTPNTVENEPMIMHNSDKEEGSVNVKSDDDTSDKSDDKADSKTENSSSKPDEIKQSAPVKEDKKPSVSKDRHVKVSKPYDELEQILSEARSKRKSNDSETKPETSPEMDSAQKSVVESYEKNMSDVDILLHQLDNM